jgi:sugar lactone lactonase YvrE
MTMFSAIAVSAASRMNDGACDPQGRFWAGTMADDHHEGGGALYRLERDGRTELMLDELTIANGVGWSPDGETMYLVDSGPRVIRAFAFDGDRGTISAGPILVSVPEDVGAPDGMTLDAAGDLWVAIYGGGRVNRYAPDGSLRDVYPIPARQSTCCAFGGPGLQRLFVTTATEGWTNEERRAEPGAGLVYRLDTAAIGLPAAPFRPDLGTQATTAILMRRRRRARCLASSMSASTRASTSWRSTGSGSERPYG